ncbi:MAG: glycoside hydrolase family 15 protein [Candidatus Saccharimonadales bacterium]
MGRPIVLSNGQLFIGLDESGLVHDFYYPYVGLENLTNARSSQHKIGIWVDGKFSWTNDGSWEILVDFEDEALISHIELKNNNLDINLMLQDFIDIETNSFIRHITIANRLDRQRDVRLFMHQVFQISRAGRADTALYVPDDNYILDYKGRYSLAISGKFKNGESFDQYAVGNYGIEGKAGTFKDAEDGELSDNAVEHGGVDSVIRFKRSLGPHKSDFVDYWVIASSSQNDAQAINDQLKKDDIEKRLERVREYWRKWVNGPVELPKINRRSLTHSLLVIKAHIDERGSILASGDSSIFNFGRDYYCYCWPRDAAYALWPLIRLGHFEEAKQFFEFARDTKHKDGYLMHKYQPDRAIGSTWHPLVHGKRKELAIQEDETASVIYMIGQYYDASKDKTFIENIYQTFIVGAANFMARFIDEQTGLPHASYDLWEEKFLTTTYTVSTVIAGLDTASYLAKIVESPDDAIRWKKSAQQIRQNLDKLYNQVGYFVKGYLLQENGELEYDYTLDISSLYGPFMYAGLEADDKRILSTATQVEKRILNVSPSGGVLRYENDNYFLTKRQYKGNPWVVSSLWLAQYYIAVNQYQKAKELMDWSIKRELSSAVLSEQFDPETAQPLGVTPLVWSHAELVNTILDISKYTN